MVACALNVCSESSPNPRGSLFPLWNDRFLSNSEPQLLPQEVTMQGFSIMEAFKGTIGVFRGVFVLLIRTA